MPDFSEEVMLEVSENITPKFSRIRFASLRNVQLDERIDHKDGSNNGGEVQHLRNPQEHLENEKHNGNGHHTDGHVKVELEVLDAQQPAGRVKRNGNGLGRAAKLDEATAPRLPKVHVAPLEEVQPAESVERNENGLDITACLLYTSDAADE